MSKMLPLLFAAGCAFAAGSPADAVKAADKAWGAATVAGDAAALEKLLADDLTYTHSTGDTDTKAVFIGNLKSGALRYHKVEHESIEVRVYGSVAVLSATARVATSRKGGQPNPAHLRFLHVWVQQKGQWRMVAHQSLRLPD